MKGPRPTLEDARCTVCSRFIPRGFVARLSNGTVQCLTHPIGTVSIDKGGLPGTLPPPDGTRTPSSAIAGPSGENPPTRRQQVMAAIRLHRATGRCLRIEID